MSTTETRNVRVRLTDAEMEERGEKLAGLTVKLGEQDAALEDDAANWKDAKKAHEAGIASTRREMAQLAREMEDRAEERPIECEWYAAPSLGWKFLVRMDTDMAIEQRPLTDEERQTKLYDAGLAEASPEEAARWAEQLAAEKPPTEGGEA